MISLKLRQVLFLFITLITLLKTSNGNAQGDVVKTMDGRKVNPVELTNNIKQIMKKFSIPGVSIAIINDNKLVYHDVFGVSNIETQEPVESKSIFEAASLSKPLFAYFALKMVDQGKLDLDRPLWEYLPHPGISPESKEDAKLITARMVLSHQTGMPNHAFGEKIKLSFKPGTGFEYSGEAYQYLAAAIGTLNGVGWKDCLNDLFKEEVSNPLGMTHSSFVWNDYIAKNKVFGHDENDGTPKNRIPQNGYWDDNVFSAYSSLHTESREYSKFVVAMLREQGLKPETFKEMLKEHTHFEKDNPLRKQIGQTGWGLGFTQKKTPEMTMHMHTGNNHDFQSYVMFAPEKNYGIVLFTNSGKMIPMVSGLSQILGPQF